MELRLDTSSLGEPDERDAPEGVILPFSGPLALETVPARPAMTPAVVVRHQAIRLRAAFHAAVIGDGLLGMRPRPVADLIRQFWLAPPPYIRDALLLRIPYAIYGAVVIPVTAAAHLVLLVIAYPALLAAAALLVTIVILIT